MRINNVSKSRSESATHYATRKTEFFAVVGLSTCRAIIHVLAVTLPSCGISIRKNTSLGAFDSTFPY